MKRPYSLSHKVLYRIPLSLIKLLRNIKTLVFDADKNTYYSELKRKSRFKIFCDQLEAIVKYGFTVDDYYPMGIDVKGKKVSDYISDSVNVSALYSINDCLDVSYKKRKYSQLALLRDKWVFSKICEAYGLSTPKAYGLIMNGKLISKIWPDFDALLEKNFNLMFKPIDGSGGKGIFHIRVDEGRLMLKDKVVSIEQLKNMLGSGRYLIQEFISNQHRDMCKLYDGACNTLRITVAREGNEFRVLGRMCMLGAHGTDCSNWHFGGVSVNLKEDGELDKYGYCKIDKKVLAHPDTGVVFEGYKIPFYEEAIALAKRATECFYGFCSIGWDIAITETGPTIIEGNDDWGIVAHQMVENRGWLHNWEQSHGKIKM